MQKKNGEYFFFAKMTDILDLKLCIKFWHFDRRIWTYMKLGWFLNWIFWNLVKIPFYRYAFQQFSGWYILNPPFHIFDGAGNLQGPYQAPGGLGEVKFGGKCLYVYSLRLEQCFRVSKKMAVKTLLLWHSDNAC